MRGEHPTPRDAVLDFTSVTPFSGGVGRVATGVATGLSEVGLEPRCLVAVGQGEAWRSVLPAPLHDRIEEIAVRLPAGSGWQTALRRLLPATLRRSPLVGLVRSLRARSTASALAGEVVWLPFHRVPLAAGTGVVTVHDLRVFEAEFSSPMDQKIIRENVARAQAVVCSWPHPFQHLVELFPEVKGKAFLIPLPVLNPGSPTPRRRLVPGAPMELLVPGFVTAHKNHETLIRALPLVPEAHLTVVGAAEERILEELSALALELQVSDRISWRGFVSTEELDSAYAAADLLVMPTRWEAASGPIFEAVARELPFVASEIPPIRAQLDSLGIEMPTFKWDDPQDLAQSIQDAVARHDELIGKVAAVAEVVRSRTWQDTAGDYARVLAWAGGAGERPDDLMPGGV